MEHNGKTPVVDQRLVTTLETLLARAKQGTVSTVGLIVVTTNGTIEPSLVGQRGLEAYLGADLLKGRIVDGMAPAQPAHALRRL